MKIMFKKAGAVLNERRDGLLGLSKVQETDIEIDVSGDDTDKIQGKIVASMTAQLIVRHRDQLARIDKALAKITAGTFGTCEECEEDIEEKRVLANPELSVCITCAEQFEKEEKLRRARGI